MITRRMRESEVTEVSRLLSESYAWLGEREGLSPEQTEFLVLHRGSTECVRRESSEQIYLVSHDGDLVVGMAAVSGERIEKLYVRPSHHGMGIGRHLYEQAESIIRAGGYLRVALVAFGSAVPFYERMGLKIVGRKQARGALAGLAMTLMEKPLR